MFFGYVNISKFNFKQMPPLSRSLPFILLSIYTVVLLVSVFNLMKYNTLTLSKNKTLENKFLQAELRLKEEELRFLKMQIHPHFLFNTLNTLYGFALRKSDKTPEMILKLADLLDYILYQIEKPKVLLAQEIKHIKNYIELEKMRFHDSLDIRFDSTVKDKQLLISPMLLLPFVENSFKHGSLVHGILKISITISIENEILKFKISNSIKNEGTRRNGIGLINIKKRLEILYPNKYTLDINFSEGNHIVVLKIKLDAQN